MKPLHFILLLATTFVVVLTITSAKVRASKGATDFIPTLARLRAHVASSPLPPKVQTLSGDPYAIATCAKSSRGAYSQCRHDFHVSR